MGRRRGEKCSLLVGLFNLGFGRSDMGRAVEEERLCWRRCATWNSGQAFESTYGEV